MKRFLFLLSFLASPAFSAVSYNGSATFVSSITVQGASPILSTGTLQSNATLFVSSGTISTLNSIVAIVSTVTVSSMTVGTSNGGNKLLVNGGGDGATNTLVEIRNRGTSGAGTGTRLSFTEGGGLSAGLEQGSFEFIDNGGSGQNMYLYLTPNGLTANRAQVLKINHLGPAKYSFGKDNTSGTAIFDFKKGNAASPDSTVVMRVSNSGINATGNVFELYGQDDSTLLTRVTNSGNLYNLGYVNIVGSATINGLVGLSSVSASGYIQKASKTSAQLGAITPLAVGEEYYCSDCATVSACISTGTAQGAFALITNKGSACQ